MSDLLFRLTPCPSFTGLDSPDLDARREPDAELFALRGEVARLRRVQARREQAEWRLREKMRHMKGLLDAQKLDRQLAAHEIHDTFLQDAIAALMLIDTAYEKRHESRREALENARRSLRKSIAAARRMVGGLQPESVHEQGIVAALGQVAAEHGARGLKIDYRVTMHAQKLHPLVESAILRIAQEALANVERHSKSPNAELKLSQTCNRIRLEVRDFGVGFDLDHVPPGHYGLQGIKQRARLINADLSIHSKPAHGTQVMVDVPLDFKPAA